ncbi:hypothetical protein [Neptuniibacter sp.]|uniref:O-linked N-acetylglucosamine transferase family protein n=1 Tax=Neptuniibacter sp. TaxID=1962643 RepID=UPI00263A3064|nr:hypothetical protein [Neptuniibacter sp.]MCP4598621.1 hypothetical protein [Neptuniibacter sp.]
MAQNESTLSSLEAIQKDINLGQCASAKQKLSNILKERKADLNCLSLLGQIACIEFGIKPDSDNAFREPNTYIQLIEKYLKKSNFQDAYQLAALSAQCFPTIIHFSFGAAMAAEHAGVTQTTYNWLQKVITEKPDHLRAHERMIVCAYKLKRYPEVKQSCFALLDNDKTNSAALIMLSNVFLEENEHEESYKYLRKFVACEDFSKAEQVIIANNVALKLCDYESQSKLPSYFDVLEPNLPAIVLFDTISNISLRSNTNTYNNNKKYLELQQQVGNYLQHKAQQQNFQLNKLTMYPGENSFSGLTYGFLSVSAIPKIGQILAPFFSKLKEQGNKVIFFNVSDNDEKQNLVRRSLKESVDTFFPIKTKDSYQVAKAIAQIETDVLVDLNGFQQPGSQVGIFSWRVSPLQLVWAGIPTPIHYDDVDGQILDPHLIHEDQTGAPSLPLPNVWTCLPQPKEIPYFRETEAEDSVVFSVMSSAEKITADQLKVWAELLKQSTTYVLLFGRAELSNTIHKQHLLDFFSKEGVDAKQIRFISNPPENHLEMYQYVDINLDTFPLHSGITLIEAAWMGVPSVVLCGTEVSQRSGLSVLNNLNLTDGIAFNATEYVDKAEAISKQLSPELRETCHHNAKQSAYFDSDSFARNFDTTVKKRLCQIRYGLN